MRFLAYCGLAWFVFFGVPAFAVDDAAHVADERPVKNVLVLVSYSLSHDWTRDLVNRIKADTARLPWRLDFTIEELDAMRRQLDPEECRALMASYLPRLKKGTFAMAVTLDDEATDLLAEYFGELPPDLPIVFGGYEGDPNPLKAAHPNLTGVLHTFDVQKNLDLGAKLFPNAHRAVVFSDDSPSGLRLERALKASLTAPEGLTIEYLNNGKDPIRANLKKIEERGDDSFVILPPWRVLYDNDYQSLAALTLDLWRAARKPFLANVDTEFGFGSLGGYITVASEHGAEVARLMAETFKNGEATDVLMLTGETTPVFDYAAMKEGGLDFGVLPPDAQFRNRPPSLWNSHRYELVALGIGVLGIVALSLVYVVAVRRTLRRSLHLYRAFPGNVCVANKEGKILFLNAPMLGDSSRFKKLEDLPNIEIDAVREALAGVLKTGTPQVLDYTLNGVKRSMALAALASDVFGEPAAVWFSHDNSELQNTRKQAEAFAAQLRKNTRMWGIIIDALPINIFAKDAANGFRYELVNNSLHRFFKADNFVGKTDFDLFPKELAARTRAEDEGVMADPDRIFENTVGVRDAEGRMRMMRIIRRAFVDEDGTRLLLGATIDMTDELAARAEVEQTAQRFALTLRSIGDGVIATDAEGRVTMLNAVAERLMGVSQAQALGKPHETFFRIVSYVDDTPIASPLAKVLKTGEPVELANHTDLIAQDGTRRHIADSAAPIRDDKGVIIGAILVFRDVTDEYDKRDALRDSRQLLAAGAELTLAAPFQYEPETQKLHGGSILDRIWPLRDGKAIPSAEWVYPPDLEKFDAALNSLIKGKTRNVLVDYRSNARGHMRYFRFKGDYVKGEGKSEKGRIIGVVQDVTEIRESAGKLKETLQLWDVVVNKIPVMIFAKKVNDDFRYVLTNRFFEEFIALPREKIIGHTDYEIFNKPESANWFRGKDEEIMAGGVAQEFLEDPIDGNGKLRHLRTIKMPFVNADGEELLLGVTVDNTQLNTLIDSERIVNQTLRQVAIEADFDANVHNIFKTLEARLACDRITLAAYEAKSDRFNLERTWSRAGVVSFENRSDLVDTAFKSVAGDLRTLRPAVVENARALPAYSNIQPYGTRSVMVVPVTEKGALKAALAVSFCKSARSFTENDENLVRSMANLIAIAQIRERQRKTIERVDRENQLILDTIKIPVWLYDAKGALLRVNKEVSRISGIPTDAIDTLSSREIFCKDLPAHETLPVMRVIQSMRAASRPVRYKGRDYVVNADPVFDDEGALIYVLKDAVDVTDLNAAVANEKIVNACFETLLTHDDIKSTVEIALKSVVEHLGAARGYIFNLDCERRCTSCVSEYYPRGQTPVFSKIQALPFAADVDWCGYFERNAALAVYDVFREGQSKWGLGEFWLELAKRHNFHSLYGQRILIGGKLWGYLGVVYEKQPYRFTEWDEKFLRSVGHVVELMLEREKSRRNLLDALKRARDADKAKSFFIASVSHEIRTPLNAVIGFSELLRDADVDDATRREYLDSIAVSGNALLQLINDVLDLSKLEAGQMQLVKESADFRALAEETLRTFLHRAREKKLRLDCEISEMPPLMLDKLRMRQVLFNLIGNALKFTNEGSVTVGGKYDEGNDILHFYVRDTGIGIAAADKQKLMEPFVQLSGIRGSNATLNGTGLGLSICKRLIEAMGGEIFVESVRGKGSIFGGAIKAVETAQPAMPEKNEAPIAPIAPVERLRVLLVDDVEMNLKVLRALCEKAGITHLHAVDSGAGALEYLRTQPCDLVLTDMWMPEMNGAELAARIRAELSLKTLPVVAITADMEARDNFDLKNFNGILLKPVTLAKLRMMLAHLYAAKGNEGGGGGDKTLVL